MVRSALRYGSVRVKYWLSVTSTRTLSGARATSATAGTAGKVVVDMIARMATGLTVEEKGITVVAATVTTVVDKAADSKVAAGPVVVQEAEGAAEPEPAEPVEHRIIVAVVVKFKTAQNYTICTL